MQSNNATFGKWPDWSYWHSIVAETLSFPSVDHTLWKSEIWMSCNGSCDGGPVAIAPQKSMTYGVLRIIIHVQNFLK